MMPPEDPRVKLCVKQFVGASSPFPRSTWVHPHAPNDDFDRVCKNIWIRAKEAEEELGGGQSRPEIPQKKASAPPESKPSHRAEEQQKETDDLGLSTKYEEERQQYHTEFTLPCPYLSGRRHPHVAKPARVLSPVMEVEMKLNEQEAERKRDLGKDMENKQIRVENSCKRIWVPQTISGTGKQSSTSETGPVVTNPFCSATEDHTPHLQEEEDPTLPSKLPKDTCKSEDEQDMRSSSDGNSSDEDFVTLPRVRSQATDSSDEHSESDNNDYRVEENYTRHSADEFISDGEKDSPSSRKEKDFPPLSTIKAGILPCPMEAPASWKMQDQWEIPLSVNPHDIATATLASATTAPAQASVRRRAESPQANSKTNTPSATPTQEGYDLLADFPALQPPKKPLAWGVLRDGNSKTRDAQGQKGHPHTPNPCQESGASHQRNMEKLPYEVSSNCTGDRKSLLNTDIKTFGSGSRGNTPTIICGEPNANNQSPPRVAGTDGVGVYARSWASAAKAGMKQAAAPQEKARPCTFQQIVTVNRPNGRYSDTRKSANKVTPSHQVTRLWRGAQTRNPYRFVRPGYHPTHQHFGAQAHRANCPPGFRCPRFPFQQ